MFSHVQCECVEWSIWIPCVNLEAKVGKLQGQGFVWYREGDDGWAMGNRAFRGGKKKWSSHSGEGSLAFDLASLLNANISLDYLRTRHELLLNLRVFYKHYWKTERLLGWHSWERHGSHNSLCCGTASTPARSPWNCWSLPRAGTGLRGDVVCKIIAGSLANRGGFSVSRDFGVFSPLNSISMKWVIFFFS